MNDQWTNRLSEYVDDELDSKQRAELEAHLETCGHCYATLADLRDVVARAKRLEDREPAKDLWAGIRARMIQTRSARPAVRPPGRRFSFSVPQLLAACIALVLLSGGAVWTALRPPSASTGTVAVDGTNSRRPGAPISPVTWTSQADLAVAELQEALTRNESRLDTSTVRVVRQNLAVIDRAIAEARVALLKDPGNTYLNLHLANTMRRKLELLRRINALVAES
jgi:hypothetical protein